MSRNVVSFHYVLTDDKGTVLDQSTGQSPLAFLEGADQIIPGLEKVIKEMQVGEQKKVHVPYQDGYGAYDQNLIFKVEKDKFPAAEIQLGDMFTMGPDEESSRIVTVVEINGNEVVLDGNHPMAGKDLYFDINIVEKREATADEVLHGHAHGPDGHHHH